MSPISPPTSLPPLRRLAEYSLEDITQALSGIRRLYWPPPPPPLPPKLSVPKRNVVHAGRSRILQIYGDAKIPDSGYASAVASDDESDMEEFIDTPESSDDHELDELRADPLERAFAIRWITGLICRVDVLSSEDPTVDMDGAREDMMDQATALLALFARQDGDGEYDVTRTFSFPSGEQTIQVELNDAPLSDSDHTSVGLQSWGSSIVLAERLSASPATFDITAPLSKQPLRVLELGAGTGLLSIVVAKLLPSCTVVATDYHPDILANLAANVRTNFPTSPEQVHIRALDWERLAFPSSAPLDAPFDVIVAADVVYQPEHARWIRGCVERMLRRPAADEGGVFHLIIPLRSSGRHEGMDRTVDEVFKSVDGGAALRLAVLHTEAVGRQGAGVGRADEAGYRMFKIGWVRSSS
ncbi:S-adenosyl-L-methionine-dependent methyltransferase [Mycena rebaudengoi]|nr:S-adenosyl-L-methionine-dependent methyltransferase [Mycena rebaudengoi]